ncbi:MAG: hypothetical protein HYY50_01510 [Candidatus Kerfeldbacteria bacterium]|nr:hypothetical protein [Candidatus Kerfeldbacteria bacterium]
MKRKQKTSLRLASRRPPVFLTAIIGLLFGISITLASRSALAGPITGGPGSAPFTKLGVYQGVISIIPGGGGNSVMEIGNAGRDIKSTGALHLVPGGGGDVHLDAGRLCFGAGVGDCRNTWVGLGAQSLDQVLAAGNRSNSDIVLGQGPGLGAGVALIDITQTNASLDAISAKQNTAGNSKAAVYGENTSASGFAGYFSHGPTGSSTTATLFSDNLYESGGSTIVNANAAKFVADVEILQKGLPAQSWTNASVLKVAANAAHAIGGVRTWPLHVRNLNPNGYAAYLEGSTYIFGQAGVFSGGAEGTVNATLLVDNTAGASPMWGNAIKGHAGNAYVGAPPIADAPSAFIGVWGNAGFTAAGTNGIGVYGSTNATSSGTEYGGYFEARNTSAAGQVRYGLYGKSGTGPGTQYAAYFEGQVVKKGSGSAGPAMTSLAISSPLPGACGVVGPKNCLTICTESGLTCVGAMNLGGAPPGSYNLGGTCNENRGCYRCVCL